MDNDVLILIAIVGLVVALFVYSHRERAKDDEKLIQKLQQGQALGYDPDWAIFSLIAELQSERRPYHRTLARLRVKMILRVRRRILQKISNQQRPSL
jgi:phosphoenolpyruvate-protein kinase (PTS system EI component)